MTNNSMVISIFHNSLSFDLDLTSSWDNNTSSSFQRSRCPPSPATNQPLENLALPNPSTKKPCGHVSLTIPNVFGMITEATLNSLHGVDALTLRRPFTLFSLNGSYLYNNHYALNPGATPAPPLSFRISFSTCQGQVFGGAIGGRVIASNDASQTICTFKNPMMYASRDKEMDEGDDNKNNNYKNNSKYFNGSDELSGFNMISCGARGW
ncbi:hypothetical protein JHK82_055198 [Glycine max]|nr:hypothetical protein JHK86_055038 [Glycine max]KAG4917730.1 hypothetical protein JHK85_056011 [Glycine max]KAG5073828.1 hypothetical protein JHK84_055059 [Glycine max]KAG5076503.1 hypothetical protein JHK82_055198 [Glycine max]